MSSQNDINNILRKGYSVDIGRFISRGWDILQQNIGGFIGFFVVAFLISIILGFIPVIGGLISLVISGPLQSGYFIVAFKIGKGNSIEFGDFFKGFQNSYFLPTFLTTLVQSLIVTACFIPMFIIFFVLAIVTGGISSLEDGGGPLSILGPIGFVVILVAFFLSIIAAIYIGVNYTLALPLVIGKRMQFWPALEASRQLVSKQWFSFFAFLFVLGLINLCGALACGLGLLITVPLTACALAAAYENIIGLPTFDPSQE